MAVGTGDPLMKLLSLSDAPLESPFPALEVDLPGISLRETAYEILVATSGFTALSSRTKPPKNKIGFTTTASRLKKALVRPKHDRGREHPAGRGRKPPTTADIVRYQFEISEQSDERTRKALIRAVTAQVNKPVESMLVPLELLQNIGPSQFADRPEYEQWRLRQLRVLEAGLVIHPAIRPESGDNALSDRLQQMLVDLAGNSLETGKSSEALQALRIAAIAKSGRAPDGENLGEVIHWADGFPLNVSLYECLLTSCFDTLDETMLIDEFFEVMEWIRKTWGILGINQLLHSLCFMWVLFRQFVITGQTEAELLVAAGEQMKEAAAEAKICLNGDHTNSFQSAVATIQAWAGKRLLAYHEIFPQGAHGVMDALLSLDLMATRIVEENTQQEARRKRNLANLESEKVDLYIRTSIKSAFTKMMENVQTKGKSSKIGDKPLPTLAALAEDIGNLARFEREKFSPCLKNWHPSPAGVASATLHACFGSELKQFLTSVSGITRDVVQVLQAANQLEMDLVQIAVEDGVDADDGGKSLIREMLPYEAQSTLETLSKKWIVEGVGRLAEWVDRNIQNEQWSPKATREGYAPSAVEVLRIIEETMDAFFALPISKDQEYVKLLVAGIDQGVRRYCEKTLAGCGKKERYIPSLPSLTRYSKATFTQKGGWRSTLTFHKSKISSSIGSSEKSLELAHLCVRINTLNHISNELQYLGKRLRYGWLSDCPSTTDLAGNDSPSDVGGANDNFKEVRSELEQGIQLLIELAAYRVVFHDLHQVFWEGLYTGGVENSRIPQVIEQVEPQLAIIADIASEGMRNWIVAALMKACLDCLVLVLLAGGPSRAFSKFDADILDEDLLMLKDLFKADGEGLPDDLVESAFAPIQEVLTLFHHTSEKLILELRNAYPQADVGGSSRFSKAAPLPRTTGDWCLSDPNTILRVLCYRADDMASKYLKRTFNLPKRLPLTR